jgi:hypothetical protein
VRLGRWLAAVAAALCGMTAAAQTIVAAPSAAQRCLTRGTVLLGTPVYPQEAFERKIDGRVVVDMEFTAADVPPRLVKIDAGRDHHARDFEDSVRAFIKAYRVPCLVVGESTTLRQEFVFVAQDRRGVAFMAMADEQEMRNQRLNACVRRAPDASLPAYPANDLRLERQGTVVAKLRFLDATGAPQVSILDDGGSAGFGRNVTDFALRAMRMPCHDGVGPVDTTMLFIFRVEGGARVVLKDMPFLTLLAGVKDIRQAQLYFDFNTMGCPFDVHFVPMQPHARNTVGEIGEPHPERRFFLDWLSRQQLALGSRELNAVLGQSARVSVPCTVVHLGQRAGGGASQ